MFSKGLFEHVSLAMLLTLYLLFSTIIRAPTFMQHEEPKANDANDANPIQG
jgi:hypothetical protein